MEEKFIYIIKSVDVYNGNKRVDNLWATKELEQAIKDVERLRKRLETERSLIKDEILDYYYEKIQIFD